MTAKITLQYDVKYVYIYPTEYRDFSILARESNDSKLTLMESLLIERERPCLNRSIKSMPLELL